MQRDDVKKVVSEAKRLGFNVSTTKNGHWRFSKPGRPPVFFSGTPGDARAFKNGIAKLRRAA